RRTGVASTCEAMFGWGMETPPPLLDLVVQVSDAVDDRHWGVPVSECVCGTRPQCSKARTKKRAGAAGFRALSISFKPRGPARCGRRHCGLRKAPGAHIRRRVINAFEPVAQSVEHVTFNHGVAGSIPAGLAIR